MELYGSFGNCGPDESRYSARLASRRSRMLGGASGFDAWSNGPRDIVRDPHPAAS
jgi:hypothetical protein